jgi:flagellin-like protein
MAKKALSPVVATVLLVALVLVLAMIIYLWASAFLPEKIQKDLGGGAAPIEDACAQVQFTAQYDSGNVYILNEGNVPLHGAEIGVKKGFGSLEFTDFTGAGYTVKTGETTKFDLSSMTIATENEIVIVPVLLGESAKTSERKAYICDQQYGKSIVV